MAENTLPQNLEAEGALLGSIFLDNKLLDEARKVVKPNDLHSKNNRLIFQAMIELNVEGREIDPVSVTDHLREAKLLKAAGDAAYISALTDGVPLGSTKVTEYCRIVLRCSKQRQALNLAQLINTRIAAGEDPDTLFTDVHGQVEELRLIETTETLPSGVQVTTKAPPAEPEKDKPKKSEEIYPKVPKGAWHPAAEIYRQAHHDSTEGSDNWHFISFYTVVGVMLGRTVGSFMGGMIYGNLYSVLVGQIGGDGKDTVADFATDFMEAIDPTVYGPETIDSKAGFLKGWREYIAASDIAKNNRCLLRLSEIKSYIDTAAQTGTSSITPMLNSQYSPRPFVDNGSVATPAHIKRPHLGMLACGCRKHLYQIDEDVLSTGLGRRFCFTPGDPKGPNPEPDPPKRDLLNPLIVSVRECVQLYAQRENCLLRFSGESLKLWKDWYKTYWKRKKGDDLYSALNNGDRVTCRKIALINAALDKSDEFIQPHHLKPAMEFIEFLYECRWPIFSEHGANPNLELDKKILAKVPDFPTRIRKRWLQQQLAMDSETFNKRLYWLTTEDSQLVQKKEGRMIWVWRAEP